MFWSVEEERLQLERDGAQWPNRAFSSMRDAGGLRWHVQRMGSGPNLLLLHGTGASTHSWRDVAPLLAKRFTIVAPDLPGHAFTSARGASSQSLPGMAQAVAALLRELGVAPQIVVGHSAGVAALAQLCVDQAIAPQLFVSFNGALAPFAGSAGHVFPALARAVFVNPLTPRLLSWFADRRTTEQLLEGTGSRIDARGVELYRRLFANPAHVEGALAMMANWDLFPLQRDLPKLKTRLVLIAATHDKAIPPQTARDAAALVPNATMREIPGFGHLAHEEAPELCAELVTSLAVEAGILTL